MIHGTVPHGRNAFVDLTVIGPSGQRCRLQAMIDTCFDGMLSLPPNVISLLRPPWKTRGRAELADGSISLYDVYEVTVLWDRRRRLILVDETDSIPLVGTALMEGYDLNIQFRSGGEVTLTRMPS